MKKPLQQSWTWDRASGSTICRATSPRLERPCTMRGRRRDVNPTIFRRRCRPERP
jgi:hypothetical protein